MTRIYPSLPSSRGRTRDEELGQFLSRFIGEKARMREGQLVDLRLERGAYTRLVMPKTRNSRATAGIEITPSVCVDQVISFTADRCRQR